MKRFKNALIVWGNESEARARDWSYAVSFAQRNGVQLRVLQVASELEHGVRGRIVSMFAPQLKEAVIEKRSRELNRRLRTAKGRGVTATGRVLPGANVAEILAEAVRFGNDLILVVGDSDAVRKLGGKLALRSPIPVIVTKLHSRRKISRILAAVNLEGEGSESLEENREILHNAIEIAREEGAVLDVAHAWNIPGEAMMDSPRLDVPQEQIDEIGRSIRRRRESRLWLLLAGFNLTGIRHHVHLVRGRPELVISDLAERLGASLLVVGAGDRGRLSEAVLGSTARRVLDRSEQTVLVAKRSAESQNRRLAA